MLTAIVLISADVHQIPETAQSVANVPGVAEVFSCAGDVDIIATLRVRDHAQIADVVTGQINKLPGVRHTVTHIAFRSYSSADVEVGFSLAD